MYKSQQHPTPEHDGRISQAAPALTVDGADRCRDCLRTRRQKDIPVLVFPDGDHQVEPTNEETAAKLTASGLI